MNREREGLGVPFQMVHIQKPVYLVRFTATCIKNAVILTFKYLTRCSDRNALQSLFHIKVFVRFNLKEKNWFLQNTI